MTDSNKSNPSSYTPVGLTELPVDSENITVVDLFVYLSIQKRFVLYIPKGEKVTSQRKEALAKHTVPCVYIRESDLSAATVTEGDGTHGAALQNFEVVGLAGNSTLRDVFENLSKNLDAPPIEALAKLESMADEILNTVAPEAANLKARFLQNMDYLWLMNDASAISALATMFAAANGINGQKALREIVFASLVMDLPLAKFEAQQIETYLSRPKDLPKLLVDQIEQHPFQAYQLAKKTLPHLSDSTLELILVHHEKYNGGGYPRHLKSVQIFPLGQIFAAAVETFERMKVSLKNENATLSEVLKSMLSTKLEPHMQRHRKEIIQSVTKFLGIQLIDSKIPDTKKQAA